MLTPMTEMTDKPTSVYRLFDAEGHLLYVGITEKGLGRFKQHARSKEWWGEVADVRMQHCGSRLEAEALEQIAIYNEQPKYNLADTDHIVYKGGTKPLPLERRKLSTQDAARSRPWMLQVRTTAEELDLLDRVAAHRHVSRAQAVRQIIVEEARRLGLAPTVATVAEEGES